MLILFWRKAQFIIEHYFVKEELERLAQENGFEIIMGPIEQLGKNKTLNRGGEYARWWVVYRKI